MAMITLAQEFDNTILFATCLLIQPGAAQVTLAASDKIMSACGAKSISSRKHNTPFPAIQDLLQAIVIGDLAHAWPLVFAVGLNGETEYESIYPPDNQHPVPMPLGTKTGHLLVSI
ncbi:MAG: hypothetical protein ACUVTR_02585 [Dehalococcoidia bacterium]